MGFLNYFSRICPDRDSVVKDALDLAGQIAKKSPIAMAGIKHNLNFSRDHSAQQGLEYMVGTIESLSADVFEPGTSTGSICSYILRISPPPPPHQIGKLSF